MATNVGQLRRITIFLGICLVTFPFIGFLTHGVWIFQLFFSAVGLTLLKFARQFPKPEYAIVFVCFILLLQLNHVFTPIDSETRTYRSSTSPPPLMRGNTSFESTVSVSLESIKTVSVVLPCASEGEFMVKTVKSIWEVTSRDILHEIVIVDDGSKPPLHELFTKDDIEKYRIHYIRNEKTIGLQGTKKKGGDAAEGDVIIFLDCHVRPEENWLEPILKRIQENPKRIVVPTVGNLDARTWEIESAGGVSKCYLTWGADFKWFDSKDNDIPVVSGGLVAISRTFWKLTGGYDKHMLGWGGENIDQSLRAWLCGGEIVNAPESKVAHMWRKDWLTRARYTHIGNLRNNLFRAVQAWYGPFILKALQDTSFSNVDLTEHAMAEFDELKENLHCKPFVYFLHRFKSIYESAGLLPKKIFYIQDSVTGLCLEGYAPYKPRGGLFVSVCKFLKPSTIIPNPQLTWEVRAEEVRKYKFTQRFHFANRKRNVEYIPVNQTSENYEIDKENVCCSGIRMWNTDMCLANPGRDVDMSVCDVSGFSEEQQIRHVDSQLLTKKNKCLTPKRLTKKIASSLKTQTPLDLIDCSIANLTYFFNDKDEHLHSGNYCLSSVEKKPVLVNCLEAPDVVTVAKSSGHQITIGDLCLTATFGRNPAFESCSEWRTDQQMFLVFSSGKEFSIRSPQSRCLVERKMDFYMSSCEEGENFEITQYHDSKNLVQFRSKGNCLSRTRPSGYAESLFQNGTPGKEQILDKLRHAYRRLQLLDCETSEHRSVWRIETLDSEPINFVELNSTVLTNTSESFQIVAENRIREGIQNLAVPEERDCLDFGHSLASDDEFLRYRHQLEPDRGPTLQTCQGQERQKVSLVHKNGVVKLKIQNLCLREAAFKRMDNPAELIDSELEARDCQDSYSQWVLVDEIEALETVLYLNELKTII